MRDARVGIDESRTKRLARRSKPSEMPFATSIRFVPRSAQLEITLNTGIELLFNPRRVESLSDTTEEDLASAKLDASGREINFARLDRRIYVARLLEAYLGPMDWSRRERQAEAARENGRLGGRPRRNAAASPRK